jgi:hypothetical protein
MLEALKKMFNVVREREGREIQRKRKGGRERGLGGRRDYLHELGELYSDT